MRWHVAICGAGKEENRQYYYEFLSVEPNEEGALPRRAREAVLEVACCRRNPSDHAMRIARNSYGSPAIEPVGASQ